MHEIIQDYEAMRTALRENVGIIKDLVKQAEAYNSIISSVKDKETKEKFEKNLEDIYKTIDSLAKQTDYMFHQYIKLAQANAEAKIA